jgi:hypothetical protein
MKAELTEEEWVLLGQAAMLGGNVLGLVLGINARPITPVLQKVDAQLREQKEAGGSTNGGDRDGYRRTAGASTDGAERERSS